MTTNAQAALEAASRIITPRISVSGTVETTLTVAVEFKTWLDAHDAEPLKRVEPTDPGKVMHPRRCLEADGAMLCKYNEPHRHGFVCSKECECKTGDELVRDYLLDGDDVVIKRPRPSSLTPWAEPEPEPLPSAEGHPDRETQLDALVIPAETTGPDELHADKRPDSYGNREEGKRGKKRKGGARGLAESIAEQAVDLTSGLGPGTITVNMSGGLTGIGFKPNDPALHAQIARQLNGSRSRFLL